LWRRTNDNFLLRKFKSRVASPEVVKTTFV
jgi:hypothetical protein